jgi:twitching motility protein PilT
MGEMEPIDSPSAQSLDSEAKSILTILLGHHNISRYTDIHISSTGIVKFRSRHILSLATNWEQLTDVEGKLRHDKQFDMIWRVLVGSEEWRTRIFRTKNYQIRVQPLIGMNGKKLAIRVQPAAPPAIKETLRLQGLIDRLAVSSGLVLVCGPIGSGKTTTAASLVAHWASRRALHVATIEDPVEYLITPSGGEVTQINCNLISADAAPNSLGLKQVLSRLLRGDIDALFIGEIRDDETRSAVLDHAATREPVLTTLHAGSIADAILRLTKQQGGSDQNSLRLSLSQCLDTVLYVDMAFTDAGVPVPVVIAIPGAFQPFRNAIAEAPAKTLNSQINQAITSCSAAEGGINGAQAYEAAIQAGATRDSVLAALPPDLRPGVAR